MYFTFNWFPPQENRIEKRQELWLHNQAPVSRTPVPARSSPPKTDPPKAHRRRCSRHRSWPLIYLSFPRSPDLMNFFCWILFLLCLSIEKWYYIFVWKLRKCEQRVKNVFSIVFSRIQPNTIKYFSKHFLKCNQTLENIFTWKYFTPGKYFTLKQMQS